MSRMSIQLFGQFCIRRKVALYKQILTEQLTEPQSALPPIEAHRALEVSASPQMEMLGP